MKRLIVLVLALLLLAQPAAVLAQRKTNVFASWYSVTNEAIISLPVESIANISIVNGGSGDLCVDVRGNSIDPDCVSTGSANPTVTILEASASIELYDFVTSGISLQAVDPLTAASPVAVVVTY